MSPCRVGKTRHCLPEPLHMAGIQVAHGECNKCPKEDVSIKLSTPWFQAGWCRVCFCILLWKYIFAVAYNFLVEWLWVRPTLESNYSSTGQALLRFGAQTTGWLRTSCATYHGAPLASAHCCSENCVVTVSDGTRIKMDGSQTKFYPVTMVQQEGLSSTRFLTTFFGHLNILLLHGAF